MKHFFSSKILIFLLIFNFNQNTTLLPISSNAIYSNELGLIATFGFYYGIKEVQLLRAEISFDSPDIIFKEDPFGLGFDGIECTPETNCVITDGSKQVFNHKFGTFIKVNNAEIPLRLPDLQKSIKPVFNRIPFSLYSGKLIIQNVIGLNAKSPFWKYISTIYSVRFFTIKLETDFKMIKASEIYNQPENIYTKLTFFSELPSRIGYKETIDDVIGFNRVKIQYVNFNTEKEAVINISGNFLFKIASEEYSKIISEVKSEICPDRNNCFTVSDTFGNLSGKNKLLLKFSSIDESQMKMLFRVNIFVSDLFYIDSEKKIKFNFVEKIQSPAQEQSAVLELGLFFMRKCDVFVTYNDESGKHLISLAYKDTEYKRKFFNIYFYWSAFGAILLVGLTILLMTPMKVQSEMAWDHSLFI